MKKIVIIMSLLVAGICHAADVKRFVVADGALTEVVYALSAEKDLLAVDTSSVYPEAARKLPNIGYIRALSAEGVLSVRPQLLITSNSAGPAPVLAQIQQAGVEVFIIKSDYSIAGLLHKIETLSELLGKKQQGLDLQESINRQLQPLQALLDGTIASQPAPKVLFFMNVQGNQLMAAGGGTQADALIKILHGNNLLSDQVSYKPLAQEALLALNPDVIIVASDVNAGNSKDMLQVFSQTAAFKNKRLLVADTSLLLGFGPRLPEALDKMARVFYPSFFAAKALPH